MEEAEEAEPDDEFKDAIEVRTLDYTSPEALLLPFSLNNNNKMIIINFFCIANKLFIQTAAQSV